MSVDWKNLFRRYGGVSKEADIRISGYLIRPDCLTRDRIRWNDESAARIIADCEKIAEELRGYRQALAARYAELSAMAYSLRLDMIRERGWKGPVTYWPAGPGIRRRPRRNRVEKGLARQRAAQGIESLPGRAESPPRNRNKAGHREKPVGALTLPRRDVTIKFNGARIAGERIKSHETDQH